MRKYGSAGGQADDRLDAVVGRAERHALRVVACRAGYDAFGFFLGCQLRDFVVGAAQFE